MAIARRLCRPVPAGLAAFAVALTMNAVAEEFRPGQSIVVDVDGGHYRGTVEKVTPQGRCTRVDYRWSAGSVYGSGHTYPGCTQSEILHSLEQAEKQHLKISDAYEPGPSVSTATDAGSSAPAASASDAAASAAPSRDSQVSQAQIQQLLASHNRWRRQVGVPPLEWSSAVANSAQGWADHLARLGRLEHDPDTKYGENLFIGSGDRKPAEAVDGWGSEKEMCDYQGQPVGQVQDCPVGHYTQMVWRNSERLGCGVAHAAGKRSSTVWVCRYDPPGNFVGQKPY